MPWSAQQETVPCDASQRGPVALARPGVPGAEFGKHTGGFGRTDPTEDLPCLPGVCTRAHFASAMTADFAGTPFDWIDVLVVAAWAVAGLLPAIRFFGWQPRMG